MHKKDSYLLGIIVGLLLPGILFLLFYVIGIVFESLALSNKYFKLSSIILISIVGNVIPLRYYFASLKYDKTGRGVLMMTFLMIVVYFFLDIDYILNE